jgi:hypothetical protein
MRLLLLQLLLLHTLTCVQVFKGLQTTALDTLHSSSCRTACTVAVLIACAAAVLRHLLYCSHPAAEAIA